MKKVIIALTAIVTMASCKKENVNPAPVPEVAKTLVNLTSVYDNGTPEILTYTYNANGKIATLSKGDYTNTFDFVSAVSLVVTQRLNADNSIQRINECTLNDKGYISKIVLKTGAGVLLSTYEYTYNADGYMTGVKSTSFNGSTAEQVFEIIDGNTVSAKLYYDNILNLTRRITYDNSKPNKTQLSYNSFWTLPGLFGKGTKHLVLETKTFNPSDILTYQILFSYELDAAGYPIKQMYNYPLLGKQGVDTYVYQ